MSQAGTPNTPPRWSLEANDSMALRLAVRAGFLVLLVAVWQLATMVTNISAHLLPSPIAVGSEFMRILTDRTLFESLRLSLSRMFIGYGISVIGGLAIGVLLARSWIVKQTLGSLFLSLQSLPSICWLPFALIWVGLNEQAIIVVIILGALFSIAITTESAIRNIPPIYLKVGRVLGARRFTLSRDILFYASLPELIGGLKIGWTFAWRSLMAAELIRQDILGVGNLLETGRQFSNMPLMFAAIFTILAIGLTVDTLVFGNLERIVRRRWGLEK